MFKLLRKFSLEVCTYLPLSSFLSANATAWTKKSSFPHLSWIALNVLSTDPSELTSHSIKKSELTDLANGSILFNKRSFW